MTPIPCQLYVDSPNMLNHCLAFHDIDYIDIDFVDLADELVPLDSHLSVMRELALYCLCTMSSACTAKCATMRFDAV